VAVRLWRKIDVAEMGPVRNDNRMVLFPAARFSHGRALGESMSVLCPPTDESVIAGNGNGLGLRSTQSAGEDMKHICFYSRWSSPGISYAFVSSSVITSRGHFPLDAAARLFDLW
jgi:hypothetical protein